MRNLCYVTAGLLAFVIFAGCHNKAKDNESVIPKDVKNKAEYLVGEEIALAKEHIYASRYMIYKDSILIVGNRDNSEITYLEMYNMNTDSLISSYFLKGRGPGELLSAQFSLDEDFIIVKDFQKKQVAFIPLELALTDSSFVPHLVDYKFKTQSIRLTKDGNGMLALNPYGYYDPVNKVGNEDASRFVIWDFNNPVTMAQYKYDVFNMTGISVQTNYDRDRVFFASWTSATVEIYDGNLNLLKRTVGPDRFELKYMVDETSIDFLGETPVTYYDSCTTKEKVFLIYYGESLNAGTKMQEWRPYIFVFDWDGNFEKSYKLDRYSYCITASQDDKVIYATAYDDNGIPKLYKYTLE